MYIVGQRGEGGPWLLLTCCAFCQHPITVYTNLNPERCMNTLVKDWLRTICIYFELYIVAIEPLCVVFRGAG